MSEPKKETVRIALPPRPETASSPSAAAKHDTARIILPPQPPIVPIRRVPPTITPAQSPDSPSETPLAARRPPVAPLHLSPASPLFQPLPKPPGREAIAESLKAPTATPFSRDDGTPQQPAPGSIQPGIIKETARVQPIPPAARSINMTKTQPLLMRPAAGMEPAPLVVAPSPLDSLHSVPRSFCWGLLGIAAVIFLIQIWNYVVS